MLRWAYRKYASVAEQGSKPLSFDGVKAWPYGGCGIAPFEWFDRDWLDCVWERRELREFTDMSESLCAWLVYAIAKLVKSRL